MKKPDDEKLSELLILKVAPSERAAIERAAKSELRTTSNWLRITALSELTKQRVSA
jgi:hypothetical protein